jgi:hypothetical protein
MMILNWLSPPSPSLRDTSPPQEGRGKKERLPNNATLTFIAGGVQHRCNDELRPALASPSILSSSPFYKAEAVG